VEEDGQRQVADQETRLDEADPHEPGGHAREDEMVLQRRARPPVVGEQRRVVVSQRVDEIDRVVRLAEAVAGQRERHRHAERERQQAGGCREQA
jgi:hypothetical protein